MNKQDLEQEIRNTRKWIMLIVVGVFLGNGASIATQSVALASLQDYKIEKGHVDAKQDEQIKNIVENIKDIKTQISEINGKFDAIILEDILLKREKEKELKKKLKKKK